MKTTITHTQKPSNTSCLGAFDISQYARRGGPSIGSNSERAYYAPQKPSIARNSVKSQYAPQGPSVGSRVRQRPVKCTPKSMRPPRRAASHKFGGLSLTTRVANLLVAIILLTAYTLNAQITWVAGNHALELSGTVSAFYNYRILKPGEVKHDNDRFDVRDAQFQLEGKKGRKLEYELQIDLADIAANMAGRYDPENPGLMDAWVKYKGLKPFDIQFGYGKLPYSRASLLPIKFSAYWQRAEFTRGDFYARRDIGLTLHRNLLRDRLHLAGGVYTGLGEVSLGGRNDASGKPEGVFRAEFDFPARTRDRELDTRHTPVPLFSIGANARYTHKVLPLGESFPAHATGAYGMKVMDGQKTAFGVDGLFMFEGFSLMGEVQQVIGRPTSPGSALYYGTDDSLANGKFRAGGYYVQAGYCFQKPKIIVSARWEDYNINDLAPGYNQRIAGAINYQLDGFGNTIKLHYIHILHEESSADPLDWTDQIRLGWQVTF